MLGEQHLVRCTGVDLHLEVGFTIVEIFISSKCAILSLRTHFLHRVDAADSTSRPTRTVYFKKRAHKIGVVYERAKADAYYIIIVHLCTISIELLHRDGIFIEALRGSAQYCLCPRYRYRYQVYNIYFLSIHRVHSIL